MGHHRRKHRDKPEQQDQETAYGAGPVYEATEEAYYQARDDNRGNPGTHTDIPRVYEEDLPQLQTLQISEGGRDHTTRQDQNYYYAGELDYDSYHARQPSRGEHRYYVSDPQAASDTWPEPEDAYRVGDEYDEGGNAPGGAEVGSHTPTPAHSSRHRSKSRRRTRRDKLGGRYANEDSEAEGGYAYHYPDDRYASPPNQVNYEAPLTYGATSSHSDAQIYPANRAQESWENEDIAQHGPRGGYFDDRPEPNEPEHSRSNSYGEDARAESSHQDDFEAYSPPDDDEYIWPLGFLSRNKKEWVTEKALLDSGNKVGHMVSMTTIVRLGYKERDIQFDNALEFATPNSLGNTFGTIELTYSKSQTAGQPKQKDEFHVWEPIAGFTYNVIYYLGKKARKIQGHRPPTVNAMLPKRRLNKAERARQREIFREVAEEIKRADKRYEEEYFSHYQEQDWDQPEDQRPLHHHPQDQYPQYPAGQDEGWEDPYLPDPYDPRNAARENEYETTEEKGKGKARETGGKRREKENEKDKEREKERRRHKEREKVNDDYETRKHGDKKDSKHRRQGEGSFRSSTYPP